MKKILSFLLCLAILFCGTGIISGAESNYNQARHNNISTQGSYFSIEDDVAIMTASYIGYEGIFSSATIKITLEKRFLFAFWNEVETWTYQSNETIYVVEVLHEVKSGTYRATFEYDIYGNAGQVDSLVDEMELKN